ncbi:MAG: hypothetical protein V3V78_00680 [Candidatus Woesearchaeota archaeon]
MAEEINELKKLSPKERIKKLKEIQERDKAEIEKAQGMLKEAEDEAVIEDELRDIPIPQLKAVDIDGLFSPAEKELFKAKRFTSDKPKEVEKKEEKKGALESIAEEAPKISEAEQQQHIEYVQQLSQKPTEQLYNRAKEIYSNFKDKGYLTQEQQKEMGDISYANRQKFDDIKAGNYPSGQLSKGVAGEMSLIEKMKGAMYKR